MRKRAFWISVAFLAVLILLLRLTVFHTLRVEGSSMETTLTSGDIVLVTRLTSPPGRFDIVECRFPGRSDTYIKRVIGLPGEEIQLSGYSLCINGKTMLESYLSTPAEDFSVSLGPDEYLVLGDNRAESYDSRENDMGMLRREDFIGRVQFILWPLRIPE